jgi:hypothetical protein
LRACLEPGVLAAARGADHPDVRARLAAFHRRQDALGEPLAREQARADEEARRRAAVPALCDPLARSGSAGFGGVCLGSQ